jgi:hypothetical protein
MSLSRKQQLAKLYKVRSVVEGMLAAVEAGALDLQQAVTTISATCMKAVEETSDANQAESV